MKDVLREDGVRAFMLQKDKRDHLVRIGWRYAMANGVALDRNDLALRDRECAKLRVPDGHDAIAYKVRCHCERLVLEVQLPEGDGEHPPVLIDGALGRAEVQGPEPDARWQEDPDESRQIRVSDMSPQSMSNKVTLTVDAPSPGYRYVLGYHLASAGTPIPDDISLLVQRVLAKCREANDSQNGIAARLTAVIGDSILGVLNPRDGLLPSTWVVHLWNGDARRLQAAFGRFAPQAWGTQYAYGSGIVGHGFRTGGPAVFFHREGSDWAARRQRLLYRRTSGDVAGPPPPQPVHQWIVCVPLLVGEKQPPIGMLGFADSHDGSTTAPKVETTLRGLAQSATRLGKPGEVETNALGDLYNAVSSAFWVAVSKLPEHLLETDSLNVARKTYETYWKPNP